MKEYHKIPTVWKRDPATNNKQLLVGQWATPELEYLASNEWTWTEKVDGTNIRVMFDSARVPVLQFGGKTDNAQIPSQLVTALDSLFRPKLDLMRTIFDGPVCLYGEGYGAKIQKGGGNYRQDQSFVLFDVSCGEWWLKREDVELVAKNMGIEIVSTVGSGSLHHMVEFVRNGFESAWGPFKAEGVVARPEVELKDRAGRRIICKLKGRDFD